MQISATTTQLDAAAKAAPRPAPAPRTEETVEVARRPGRRHIQRDLKHLVRDVRHQVRDELQELQAQGGDEEKIAAVRDAFHDFRDQVQAAFKDAGRGGRFDAGAVPEGLSAAMVSFTEALRALNGPEEDEPAAPADGVGEAPAAPVAEDGQTAAPAPVVDEPLRLPAPEITGPAGNLLDVTA